MNKIVMTEYRTKLKRYQQQYDFNLQARANFWYDMRGIVMARLREYL